MAFTAQNFIKFLSEVIIQPSMGKKRHESDVRVSKKANKSLIGVWAFENTSPRTSVFNKFQAEFGADIKNPTHKFNTISLKSQKKILPV